MIYNPVQFILFVYLFIFYSYDFYKVFYASSSKNAWAISAASSTATKAFTYNPGEDESKLELCQILFKYRCKSLITYFIRHLLRTKPSVWWVCAHLPTVLMLIHHVTWQHERWTVRELCRSRVNARALFVHAVSLNVSQTAAGFLAAADLVFGPLLISISLIGVTSALTRCRLHMESKCWPWCEEKKKSSANLWWKWIHSKPK